MAELSGAYYAFLCQSLCHQERPRVCGRSSSLAE